MLLDISRYDEEFETLWEQLYEPKNRKCPVWLAIRRMAGPHRPIYISTADFEGALPGRIYQKLKANFHEKRRAGISVDEWRRRVGKLSLTALAAAKEESQKIREGSRSVAKPVLQQLDAELLSQVDEPFDPGSEVLVTADWFDDLGKPILDFLRGEPHTSDALQHLLVCADCQTALQLIIDYLLDFVVIASTHAFTNHHVSVVRQLKVLDGAVQFLIDCLASDDADQSTRNCLDNNISLLGYPKILQHTGTLLSPRSPQQLQERNKFLRTWALASSLAALISRANVITRGFEGLPFVAIRSENTLSNRLAVGSLVILLGKCTVAKRPFRPVLASDRKFTPGHKNA